MNQQHLRAIELLVSEYCEKHRLMPTDQQLHINLSFKTISKTIVTFEKNAPADFEEVEDIEIMDRDAIEVFSEYTSTQNQFPSRIVGVIGQTIDHIFRDKRPTMRDIVLHGDSSGNKEKLDWGWLGYRNFGPKSLAYLDEWLDSLGLKRIGTKPE